MHKLLVYGGKLVVVAAAAWAVGASLYIFFSPISVHGETSLMLRDSSTFVEAFSRDHSWYEARGLWGTLWLVAFSGLYLLAVRAAWRSNLVALTIVTVVAVVLSIVTGFSIGRIYLPAAFGLLIGTLIFLSMKLLKSQ